MKNKNLLILCPSFPDSNNILYWWIFVKEYVKNIHKHFDNIYVFSSVPFLFWFTKKEKLCRDYSYDNIKVFYPRFFHLPIKYFREKIWDNQFRVTNKFIIKESIKFNMIHSHFIWPSWYVWMKLKEKYNKKLIITGHWYDVYDLPFENDYWSNKIKIILSKADEIITVSKSNLVKLNKLWFENIKIISNWYNSKNFYYIKDKFRIKSNLNINHEKKIILTVWNLVWVKNQKALILACNELVKNREDFICYIIWDWVLKKDLQNLIDKNNLDGYVKLLWRKWHKDISMYMNISDVFVLPSFSEWNPTVVFEALACWLPVIWSNSAWGLPEIINTLSYWLILENPNNYIDLKVLLEKSFLIKYNKEKIINYSWQFDWDIIWKKYLKIYN